MLDREHADVGVIVARFQVHELHEAHRALIDEVVKNHDKVLIFLGLSPAKVSVSNPLDFEARKQMVLQVYPGVNVLYIKDIPDDAKWSARLDDQITDLIGPMSTVELYGGRESFSDHYTGRFPVNILVQESYMSATQIRKNIAKSSARNDPAFRAGVIWAAANQYPKLIPTVDIAIWDETGTKLLMARKPHETKFRFIGGFAQPGSSNPEGCYEQTVRREVSEEAGIEISDPKYLGSCVIDDWRYRREQDKIGTLFFEAVYTYGAPTPHDDVEELRWFSILDVGKHVVDEHKPLLVMLKYDTQLGGRKTILGGNDV